METSRSSGQPLADCTADKFEAQRKLVAELKTQWSQLWSERFNDRVKAEGISVSDYARLYVERGTVLHATRDCKTLNFREIVEKNLGENTDRVVQPNVVVGGWNKFIKTQITNSSGQKRKRAASYTPEKRELQQPKKGGRGWLHVS
jgi:hypothetical protein